MLALSSHLRRGTTALQERYAFLERDYEVELLLKVDAQHSATSAPVAEAAMGAPTVACDAPRSPARQAGGGPQTGTQQAQAQLRGSRTSLLLERQQVCPALAESSGDAQRHSTPVSQPADLIVSLGECSAFWRCAGGRRSHEHAQEHCQPPAVSAGHLPRCAHGMPLHEARCVPCRHASG